MNTVLVVVPDHHAQAIARILEPQPPTGPVLCGYHDARARSFAAHWPHMTGADVARLRADLARQCPHCTTNTTKENR